MYSSKNGKKNFVGWVVIQTHSNFLKIIKLFCILKERWLFCYELFFADYKKAFNLVDHNVI